MLKGYYKSPIGWMEIGLEDDVVVSILFTSDYVDNGESYSDFFQLCVAQLSDYFEGKIQQFTFPYDAIGTDFQRRVWTELQNIPFGETISYEMLSKRIGNLKAIRAVASANGSNPLHVLMPCHRVIGKNGQLTGYAGGLWRKQWLLEHEAKVSGKGWTLF